MHTKTFQWCNSCSVLLFEFSSVQLCELLLQLAYGVQHLICMGPANVACVSATTSRSTWICMMS